MEKNAARTVNLEDIGIHDLEQVGGKNASLGEMMSHLTKEGLLVPHGFATTAFAFREFLKENNLSEKISAALLNLEVQDVSALKIAGQTCRSLILNATFSDAFSNEINDAYQQLTQKIGHTNFSVAVRSSATAEDLPEASFAGQQETLLNISGIESILKAILEVFASLYTDRAIAYRVHHGFSHEEVALSVGIQQMIRSDLASSGVMFTLDTESGFDGVVFITAAYGLGEMVVQGAVNPDEFYVYKTALVENRSAVIRKICGSKAMKMVYATPSDSSEAPVKTVPVSLQEARRFSLTSAEIESLARHALIIEKHYGKPMDIEWAKDGLDGKLYILQARPETVKSRHHSPMLERYHLTETGRCLVEGRSIGQKIGKGCAKVVKDIKEMNRVQVGDVLVADMTDPDWEPIMKKASAIVTNRGGRTCHAAIIARELGIPAVVGCGNATHLIQDGYEITVSCAEGDTGYVYEGLLAFERVTLDVQNMPTLPIQVMLNVGNPDRAFAFQSIPNAGVGLARIEFLISAGIGIHPKALLNYETLEDSALKAFIEEKISAYESPVEYYIERLKEGIVTIAAAFYPKPVIVRLSDFKSNEYANLAGGKLYEPYEENPMLGFRGASRYCASEFSDCFALECQAIRRAREVMGFKNIQVMIPFVRTVQEAESVLAIMGTHGLSRGKEDLRIIMMCEIPSNALLADKFLEHFDGFSIGSNDLTQLTLGLDRDSGLVASQFDERNEAVLALLHLAIKACKAQGKYVGICGQGPSDHKDFAKWLMEEGIDSVSLNPDSVLETSLFLAETLS